MLYQQRSFLFHDYKIILPVFSVGFKVLNFRFLSLIWVESIWNLFWQKVGGKDPLFISFQYAILNTMCLKLQIYSLTCRCCIYLGSLLGFVAGFMGFFPFCLYHTVQIIVTLWYVLMYCLLITFLWQSFLAVLMGNAFFFWLTYLYTVELTPCSVHFYGFWQMFEIVYPATMAHDSKLLQVALL